MTPMDNGVDDQLRRTLRRVDPPAGFADRVLQRAAADARRTRRVPALTGVLRWAMDATLVAAVGGGSLWYRAEERRRVQGEEARRQVLVSLSIAGGKLRLA